MRDNPEGSELDPAVDDRRRSKKNYSSILSCMGKRTKEGCDRDSEVETLLSGRGKECLLLHQRLAASSWWRSPSLYRSGESKWETNSRGPTIWSLKRLEFVSSSVEIISNVQSWRIPHFGPEFGSKLLYGRVGRHQSNSTIISFNSSKAQ